MKRFLISLMAGIWSPIIAAIISANIGFVIFLMLLVNDHAIAAVAAVLAVLALGYWGGYKLHVWCFYQQQTFEDKL